MVARICTRRQADVEHTKGLVVAQAVGNVGGALVSEVVAVRGRAHPEEIGAWRRLAANSHCNPTPPPTHTQSGLSEEQSLEMPACGNAFGGEDARAAWTECVVGKIHIAERQVRRKYMCKGRDIACIADRISGPHRRPHRSMVNRITCSSDRLCEDQKSHVRPGQSIGDPPNIPDNKVIVKENELL